MSKRRTIKLPAADASGHANKKRLPFNGSAVTEKSLSFSFACFDRSSGLFDLKDNTHDGVVSGLWFVALLECLKEASNKKATELILSSHFQLHRIDREYANSAPPVGFEQYEYWQFRVSRSKGRVIGFIIDGIFYVIWLDPHHDLTDSEGYGGVFHAR